MNATLYPLTSIPLLIYCTRPAVCLLTAKFIILRWSGVSIQEWWRNQQFWVIVGVSSNLFAVFQGMVKAMLGLSTSSCARTTNKSGIEDDAVELYTFKWTSLRIFYQ